MKRILVFLLLVPAPLWGQARTVLSGYVAADGGIEGDPLLAGITAARESGPLAARLSLGFDVSAPAEAGPTGVRPPGGLGSADVDGMLYLGNPRGSWPLIPYALAG